MGAFQILFLIATVTLSVSCSGEELSNGEGSNTMDYVQPRNLEIIPLQRGSHAGASGYSTKVSFKGSSSTGANKEPRKNKLGTEGSSSSTKTNNNDNSEILDLHYIRSNVDLNMLHDLIGKLTKAPKIRPNYNKHQNYLDEDRKKMTMEFRSGNHQSKTDIKNAETSLNVTEAAEETVTKLAERSAKSTATVTVLTKTTTAKSTPASTTTTTTTTTRPRTTTTMAKTTTTTTSSADDEATAATVTEEDDAENVYEISESAEFLDNQPAKRSSEKKSKRKKFMEIQRRFKEKEFKHAKYMKKMKIAQAIKYLQGQQLRMQGG